MCAAFSSFANNGNKIVPFGVKEILDNSGSVVEQTGPFLTSAMSPETAATMRSLLTQAVNWGTGTRAQIKDYQVFGKTGTTNDFTDVWFVGGTPDLMAVVYIGNDNHKTLGRAFGGTVAAPVWKEFMEQAVQIAKTPRQFTIPPGTGVQAVTICRSTGYIAASSCPKKANILMTVGQVPESRCPWHGGDMTAARNDTNAPLLILSPNDDDTVRRKYQIAPAWQAPAEEPQQPLPPPQQQYEQAPPPLDPFIEPYREDPAPADDINRRFQELLEQYGITN
jgi:penicillin-binding protein 1A